MIKFENKFIEAFNAFSGDFKDFKDFKDARGYNIMHYVCMESGRLRDLKTLIKLGFDINIRTSRGQTPLHIAVEYGKANFISHIITNGGEVNLLDDDGETALHYAIRGHYSALKEKLRLKLIYLLLIGGAKNIGSKYTPLYWAERKGDKEIIKLLKLYLL